MHFSTGLLSVETTRDGFRVTLSSNIDEIQAEDFADLLQFLDTTQKKP